MEIKVGDRVRSYDFPGVRDDCYVEGTVTAIGYAAETEQDCPRYTIAVVRTVFGGEEVPERKQLAWPAFVYPPVNGTLKLLGGVTDGVVKI